MNKNELIKLFEKRKGWKLDREYPKETHKAIGLCFEYENGFKISIVAGEFFYSCPRENVNDFSCVEIAVLDKEGNFTKLRKKNDDNVFGYQSERQLKNIIKKIEKEV